MPRMLLHRSPKGGPISRDKLIGRFDQFAAGHWGELINASHKCAQEAATAFRRRQRRSTDPDAHRARRALQFVQLGELSSGRQALEGAGTLWISCASDLMCPENQPRSCQRTLHSSIWTKKCSAATSGLQRREQQQARQG